VIGNMPYLVDNQYL